MSREEAIYQALSQDMRDKVDEIQAEAERRYKNKLRAYREKKKKEAEKCLSATRTMMCFLLLLSLGINLFYYLTNDEIIATCCAISWLSFGISFMFFIVAQIDYNEK